MEIRAKHFDLVGGEVWISNNGRWRTNQKFEPGMAGVYGLWEQKRRFPQDWLNDTTYNHRRPMSAAAALNCWTIPAHLRWRMGHTSTLVDKLFEYGFYLENGRAVLSLYPDPNPTGSCQVIKIQHIQPHSQDPPELAPCKLSMKHSAFLSDYCSGVY